MVLLKDVLSKKEYNFLSRFTDLPAYDHRFKEDEWKEDEWDEFVDDIQMLATFHVQNDDEFADKLYDIAWKVSEYE